MMLKKFKILMLIIILSLIGIITVVSIWLYGSYANRLEIAVTEVERSLFNSIQGYYYLHTDNVKQNHKGNYRNFDSSDFIRELTKEYSNVDSIRVKTIIDSLLNHRFNQYNSKRVTSVHSNSNRQIVPSFILQQLEFDTNTLVSIDSLLDISLRDKGIYFDIDLILEKLGDDDRRRFKPKVSVDSLGFINTRSILINPEDSEYLRAKFEQPVSYVLGKMLGQLVVAVFLVFGLIGTFVYLFWTINRQNKLALVRKSFVNNMTHELKTPVATVMAAIEAVQRFGAKDDKVKMEKYLQISQQELTHLANMIEKVLQLDMDEVKGIVLNKQRMDVKILVDEVIELAKLGANKPVDINFVSSEEHLWINADLEHLKNIFNNLLDNAIKYSNGNTEVDISIYIKDHKELLVEIKDNGIGIDHNYLKSIFEMFFRVPNGDLHPVKGFGLGLAYVKQVVEQHKGTVAVNSELGVGTTFIIRLPI